MAHTLFIKDQEFTVGDTISVGYKIKEGEKFRIQQFAGVLLKVRGATDVTKTFTIRKMSKAGIGVERIFPIASPFIDSVELVKKTSNSRAKIYFVRELSDKKMRRKLYHSMTQKEERAARERKAALASAHHEKEDSE